MAGRDPWSWFDDDGKHVEPHELDDVDMVQRAEKIFGIELPAEQLSTVCTVGEFYDLIMRELGGSKRATRACLTQTAFYRLRRALAEMGASGPITPGTPVHRHNLGFGENPPGFGNAPHPAGDIERPRLPQPPQIAGTGGGSTARR